MACQMRDGRHRHFQVTDSVFRQRIDHRVGDRGQSARRTGFAATFRTERIALGWNRMTGNGNHRRVVRARHGVVHERPRHQLAVGVVDGLLQKHLAKTLHHAALNLAFDQKRIDDGAQIIDRGIAHDVRRARVRIHLHLGDMATIGECGRDRLCDDMINVERGRNALRQFGAAAYARSKLQQADRTVGPCNDKAPRLVFDVARRCLQDVRRDLLAPFDHDLRRFRECGAVPA